jgi:hypothetical protein
MLKEGANKKQLNKALSQETAALLKTTTLHGKECIGFEVQPFNKIILGEELWNSIGNVGSTKKHSDRF